MPTRRAKAMISGGNATVYVSDIDAAIRFYTESLGLKLANRIGRRWATIEAGPSYWTTDEIGAGLIIGLHPRSPNHAPGIPGAVGFGLETYEPIEDVIRQLVLRSVRITGDIIRFEAGNSVGFQDCDGTPSYLHEFPPEMVPDSDLEADEDSTAAEAGSTHVSGGHAIVYVSDVEAAARFYTQTLGLNLTNSYGNKWATVEAGRDLVIGLHPHSSRSPRPGTKGSISLGLVVDEPIKRVVSQLVERGVRLAGDPIGSELGTTVEIEDLDGNAIYLWEPEPNISMERDLAVTGAISN
jgi:predicted enzyme related to lactoylglutathione lyase